MNFEKLEIGSVKRSAKLQNALHVFNGLQRHSIFQPCALPAGGKRRTTIIPTLRSQD